MRENNWNVNDEIERDIECMQIAEGNERLRKLNNDCVRQNENENRGT